LQAREHNLGQAGTIIYINLLLVFRFRFGVISPLASDVTIESVFLGNFYLKTSTTVMGSTAALQELAALKAEYESLKQQLAIRELLSAGEYYAPMENLWETGFVTYNEGQFEDLRCEKAPSSMERRPQSQRGETLSAYPMTLQKAMLSWLHRPATEIPVVVEEDETKSVQPIFMGNRI
jgi:hypothetical protein